MQMEYSFALLMETSAIFIRAKANLLISKFRDRVKRLKKIVAQKTVMKTFLQQTVRKIFLALITSYEYSCYSLV